MYSILIMPFIDNVKIYQDLKSRSIEKDISFAFVLENVEGLLNSKKINNEILSYRLNSFKSDANDLVKYF